MPNIVLFGTLDTKLKEFAFLYDQITRNSWLDKEVSPIKVTVIDCGRNPDAQDAVFNELDIPREHVITQKQLTTRYGEGKSLSDLPRGEVIKHMTSCMSQCIRDLLLNDRIDGVISAGGSGGSSLAAAVMREVLPIGMPKLLVSTVASGDTGPLVGETDITMMYSVVDIAGNNQLLRTILRNAANAIVGMAAAYEHSATHDDGSEGPARQRIGVTMFGVTTPAVDAIRQHLETYYPVEVFVFHATGHGGRAMERLVKAGRLDAVIDLTTTEICDHLLGGNMSAGPERLEAALQAGIPNLISVGAADMVNFGPRSSVPDKYTDRKLYEHNPTVTLMRTTPEDCRNIGQFIADKIKTHAKDTSKVQVWVPRGGVSMLSVPGGPYYDQAADEALYMSLREGLRDTGVALFDSPREINDTEPGSGFAGCVANAMAEMLQLKRRE